MNKKLINKLLKFRDDRDWKQFHTPENLVKSISIESAELLELFQWTSNANIEELKEEVNINHVNEAHRLFEVINIILFSYFN